MSYKNLRDHMMGYSGKPNGGQFYKYGGRVFYRQHGGLIEGEEALDGYPPQVVKLLDAVMAQRISPQQAIKILQEMGLPQEMIDGIMRKLISLAQGASHENPEAPAVPMPGTPMQGEMPAPPVQPGIPLQEGGQVPTMGAIPMPEEYMMVSSPSLSSLKIKESRGKRSKEISMGFHKPE